MTYAVSLRGSCLSAAGRTATRSLATVPAPCSQFSSISTAVNPCRKPPVIAASSGFSPCANSPTRMPASTSPVPAVASSGVARGKMYVSPSGLAMTGCARPFIPPSAPTLWPRGWRRADAVGLHGIALDAQQPRHLAGMRRQDAAWPGDRPTSALAAPGHSARPRRRSPAAATPAHSPLPRHSRRAPVMSHVPAFCLGRSWPARNSCTKRTTSLSWPRPGPISSASYLSVCSSRMRCRVGADDAHHMRQEQEGRLLDQAGGDDGIDAVGQGQGDQPGAGTRSAAGRPGPARRYS